MIVYVHMAIVGTSPFRRHVKMKVPEGATVKSVLLVYKEKYKADHILGSTTGISVLVNGARADFEQILKDNDQIKVFRLMVRG